MFPQLKKIIALASCLFLVIFSQAQIDNSEFAVPKKYVVAGVTVFGSQTADVQTIKLFAGIKEGDNIMIPGDRIAKAIKNLWDQDLFSDVKIGVAEVRGESAYLVIEVQERKTLERYDFSGITKSEATNLREELVLRERRIANENQINIAKNQVKNYFIDKGYLKARVFIHKHDMDSLLNRERLVIEVRKGDRIKINKINFDGLTAIKPIRLKRKMKDTKEKHWYRIFKRSKFKHSDYNTDKKVIVQSLNKRGYRNAKLEADTTYFVDDNSINIDIKIKEDKRFYFRNITYLGNSKYKTADLENRLGINKGDIYDRAKLSEQLFGSANGNDVSSLYLDRGYLSFNANPVEVLVENDSIDIEIRVYEGKQYRVNKIIISGNSMTNEHVIRREIRTRPGDLFSRSDIIRTQRELSQLGYFDPAGFQVNPQQNPSDGTVDIEYVVAEKPSDQIELQGGWGNNQIVGTLALSFNNFSLKGARKGSNWRPVPRGDGQRLSLRAQSSGNGFQSYSISFLEPWLGGKRPTSFSVSASHSVIRNVFAGGRTIRNSEGDRIPNPNDSYMKIYGGSVGFGKRLKVPDDYFQFFGSLNYQNYFLNNYNSARVAQNINFDDGTANNLSATLSLSRDSRAGNPIFHHAGSKVGITTQFTPPWSSWNRLKDIEDFSNVDDQEKYRWIEYHKWKFTAEWYKPLSRGSGEDSSPKLVLFTKFGTGYLGTYNRELGISPFERYYLGGSPLSGVQFDGREIISLRGYDDNSLSTLGGDAFINKYTMEMRYLLSPSPSATIYALGFLEAGDSWTDFKDFNPFKVKRSGGVGLRLFLPMFGLLGLDYGWRFDDVFNEPNMARGQFHFSIGTNLGEL